MPLIGTRAAASSRGFGRFSGAGDYYLNVFANDTFINTTTAGILHESGSGVFNGYVGKTSTISKQEFGGIFASSLNSGIFYVALPVTLGSVIIDLYGCRGGNDAGTGSVSGGNGLTIRASLNLPSLSSKYSLGAIVNLYCALGYRGTDLSSSGETYEAPSAPGGASSVLWVESGGTKQLVMLAASGGGAYYASTGTHGLPARPGIPAFLPAVPGTTTFECWNNANLYANQLASSLRPWADEGYSSTGSGNGSSWDYIGAGYGSVSVPDSSWAEPIPSIRDQLSGTWSPTTYGKNATTYPVWLGGGIGAYGAGGGSGYYGGFHGGFQQNQDQRAWGGQGYVDTSVATVVQSSTAATERGRLVINPQLAPA